MKQPVKFASLPLRQAVFDPSAKGLIRLLPPELVAYQELMGQTPPVIDDEQMLFTGRRKVDKEILNKAIGKKTYEPDPKPVRKKGRKK